MDIEKTSDRLKKVTNEVMDKIEEKGLDSKITFKNQIKIPKDIDLLYQNKRILQSHLADINEQLFKFQVNLKELLNGESGLEKATLRGQNYELEWRRGYLDLRLKMDPSAIPQVIHNLITEGIPNYVLDEDKKSKLIELFVDALVHTKHIPIDFIFRPISNSEMETNIGNKKHHSRKPIVDLEYNK